MQSRLAQVDRARKDFIANASHELRTPLFSLAGFLELLESDDIDAATRDEFLDTMRSQVTRLTKLATDLLDLSRLDSGAVSIEQEPLDLASTARTLVREFRGLASRHGSRVVLARESVPAEGIGDEQRVQQIGRVLVDNAIRHNPRGTNVRVLTGADNGLVTLTVSDDGPGISEEARPHLFDRFYRGAGTPRRGPGWGLRSPASWPSAWTGHSASSRPRDTPSSSSHYLLGQSLHCGNLPRMQRINVGHKSLADYRSLIGATMADEIKTLAEPLRGRRMLHLSATAFGGGVAEIQYTLLPLLNDVGIDAEWRVIEGRDEFFDVTKTIHNGLQGDPRGLTEEQREVFVRYNQLNADALEDADEWDMIVVHDPQPAMIRDMVQSSRPKWVWRCHIDLSSPNPDVLGFLAPALGNYDAAIFHMHEYIPAEAHLPGRWCGRRRSIRWRPRTWRWPRRTPPTSSISSGSIPPGR